MHEIPKDAKTLGSIINEGVKVNPAYEAEREECEQIAEQMGGVVVALEHPTEKTVSYPIYGGGDVMIHQGYERLMVSDKTHVGWQVLTLEQAKDTADRVVEPKREARREAGKNGTKGQSYKVELVQQMSW